MALRLAAALLLACASTAASPHDLWIEREAGNYALYNGHLHSGHDGTTTIPYADDFVTDARCYDTSGAEVAQAAGGSPFRMPGPCAAVTISASSGFWSKTPFGTKNLPADEVAQVVKSWRSLESVKRIDAWSPAFSRPLTRDLEVVPLVDPLSLEDGDKLRLLITFDGEPVSGAVVTYDGDPRGASDAEGKINVRIRHGGFQLVEAGLNRPLDSPKAEEEIHAAVLNFELPR